MGQRTVSTNDIELRVTEQGEGRPVILCHGFPELAYSWRHQLPALADAGYRAIAPDMRGFGGSSAPQEIEAYDVMTLVGDMLGLLDDLGEERAVFVGHDWGASVTWTLALTHPERVEAVVGMSVPFAQRAAHPPTEVYRRRIGDGFYILWFQEPGVAEEALSRDVRRTILTRQVWNAEWADQTEEELRVPRWMDDEDARVYVETFERTGFTGGLNWYRNIDRNWELMEPYADRKIERPALFVTGSRDPVKLFMPASLMDDWVPDLRTEEIEGAGHWVQQQSPEEVNEALLGFLRQIEY
ncbi:MAG: alpha/beta fold hydrolase [Gaiellaceae bacterium]